jgi:hypothetical protein
MAPDVGDDDEGWIFLAYLLDEILAAISGHQHQLRRQFCHLF